MDVGDSGKRVSGAIVKLLAIDTSSTLCSACVYDTTTQVEDGRDVLDLGKGHAEHLMAVVEGALQKAEIAFSDIGSIAVSIGPGSFTGVRVGVSAARGFAMALGIPASSVTTLEALAAEVRESFGARQVLSALDAGRGEINAAFYDGAGGVIQAPSVMSLADAVDLARSSGAVVTGSAAQMIIQGQTALQIGSTLATADIRFYAQIAAGRKMGDERPKPLYLRDADAKPQAGFVLPRQEK